MRNVSTVSFPGRGGCRYVVSQSRAGSHGKAAETFACRELLRDLCRGFVPMCGPGGGVQSPATVKQTVKALRHLARVVDKRAGARASSLRLRDLTTDDLKALEDRLLELNRAVSTRGASVATSPACSSPSTRSGPGGCRRQFASAPGSRLCPAPV